MREISASERRPASYILFGFLALVVLPYALAPLILPQNSVWGGLLGSADDQNVHLMWARQARDGHLFFRDLFTTEGLLSGEKPLFFNLLPLLMGLLSRVTTLDVVFPYHILRVALAAWAMCQFYELTRAATGDDRYRRARLMALFLAAFTTGAGFLAALPGMSQFLFVDRADGNFPLMPELFLLLSALFYPLNIASFGLLAFLFRKIINKESALLVFGAALLLSNIHTYDALPLLVTAALWAVWRLKNADKATAAVAGAAIVGGLLPVAYQFLVFHGSAEFRVKALTLTPPPDAASMLLTLAPLLILAAFSFRKWRELPAAPLLVLWIVVTFAMVYTPTSIFSFARKMIEGVQMPLLILAGIGLSELLEKIAAGTPRKMVAVLVLCVLALSPLQYFGWLWNNTLENNGSRWRYYMPPLSLSNGDAGALKALDAQTGDGAVLCLPFIGNYVPRATGKFTYAGHWAETLSFIPEKFPNVNKFYSGQMSNTQALDFLHHNHIRWVVEGEFEKAAFKGASMGNNLGLKQIYSGGDSVGGVTTVFEVR